MPMLKTMVLNLLFCMVLMDDSMSYVMDFDKTLFYTKKTNFKFPKSTKLNLSKIF